jgi:hypothetical protein
VMAGYCSYKKVELSRLPLYSSISPALYKALYPDAI